MCALPRILIQREHCSNTLTEAYATSSSDLVGGNRARRKSEIRRCGAIAQSCVIPNSKAPSIAPHDGASRPVGVDQASINPHHRAATRVGFSSTTKMSAATSHGKMGSHQNASTSPLSSMKRTKTQPSTHATGFTCIGNENWSGLNDESLVGCG